MCKKVQTDWNNLIKVLTWLADVSGSLVSAAYPETEWTGFKIQECQQSEHSWFRKC